MLQLKRIKETQSTLVGDLKLRKERCNFCLERKILLFSERNTTTRRLPVICRSSNKRAPTKTRRRRRRVVDIDESELESRGNNRASSMFCLFEGKTLPSLAVSSVISRHNFTGASFIFRTGE